MMIVKICLTSIISFLCFLAVLKMNDDEYETLNGIAVLGIVISLITAVVTILIYIWSM